MADIDREQKELRRLRALERALKEWVGGKVPAWAQGVTITEEGAVTYTFERAILGRNPLAASDDFQAIERAADRASLEVAKLRRILRALRRGDCYCEAGIGNPMMPGHTEACIAAQEATK